VPTVPLPERPHIEQLKKQARLLQRAVRAGDSKALSLVAEHHSGSVETATFTLDAAQFVLARSYGFASWPKLRQHVADVRPPAQRPRPASGPIVLTTADRYRVRPGWAATVDLDRCARAFPEATGWRPVVSAYHNAVTVIAFTTPDGPRFAELTPTTVTLSSPGDVAPGGRATLLFHTSLGTLAGVVAPDVGSLSLERPTDLRAREDVVIQDGVFVVPNAFTVTPTGLVFRFDNRRTGDIVAAADLPRRSATGVVDRSAPRGDRESPTGKRLATAIATADAPPVVDPDQWSPGVHLRLTDTEDVQLGHYGDLLGWHKTDDREDDGLYVFDLGPREGPLHPFIAGGATVVATRMYYDFRNGSSDTVAVVGLVRDSRVASITLRRREKPDSDGVIDGDTFIIPGQVRLGEDASGAVLVTRDAAGTVLEEVPYRRT
jgi:hypothetical protein